MRQDQAGSSGENDLPKHLSSTYLLWLPGKIGLWFFAAVVSALTAAQLWESRPHSYLDKHDTISFPSDKSRIAQGGGKECDITDHSTLLASKRDIFIIHLAEMQDHSKKSFYEITLRCFHIWSLKSVRGARDWCQTLNHGTLKSHLPNTFSCSLSIYRGFPTCTVFTNTNSTTVIFSTILVPSLLVKSY